MEAKQGIIIGNVSVALGMLCFGANQVIVAYFNIKVITIMFWRFLLQLAMAVAWWVFYPPTSPYVINIDTNPTATVTHWYGDAHSRLNIWIRAAIYAVMMPMGWYGVLVLPLGAYNCIVGLYPLLVIYGAHFWLGEELPPKLILVPATIFTFAGLIIVSQPPFLISLWSATDAQPIDTFGLLATIGQTIGWGLVVLSIRTMTEAHFLQIEITGSLLVVIASAPFMLLLNHFELKSEFIGDWFSADYWVFSFESVLPVVLMSLVGFGNIALNTIGYQLGEAALVGWMEYLQIPIAFLYQIFIFKQSASAMQFIGAVLVFIGCTLPLCEQLRDYLLGEKVEEGELAEAREEMGFLEKDHIDVLTENATDEDEDKQDGDGNSD